MADKWTQSKESRCPTCGTLLTKAIARVLPGTLTQEQFDVFKKHAVASLGTQTKCRKCKRLVETKTEIVL